MKERERARVWKVEKVESMLRISEREKKQPYGFQKAMKRGRGRESMCVRMCV